MIGGNPVPQAYYVVTVQKWDEDGEGFKLCECNSLPIVNAIILAVMSSEKNRPNWIKVERREVIA